MKPDKRPGTYILWLYCHTKDRCVAGKLGQFDLQPGHYAYVGSAFGPGGLAARLHHHLRTQQRPHWHIDYLRRFTSVREIWYTYAERHLEHRWAHWLAQQPGVYPPLLGFGSSDCHCPTHLFYFREIPPQSLLASEGELRRWML